MIPEQFVRWAFLERGKSIERMNAGKKTTNERFFLDFTRHTPAIVTNGPAGLNASVKGVGFVPNRKRIEEVTKEFKMNIGKGRKTALELLLKNIYSRGGMKDIDFSRLVTLELAKKHTYQNLQANREATILYYEPPMISFELRCSTVIHDKGIYHDFANAVHDLYHKPPSNWEERWKDRPAYLFTIKEIYDNSVSAMGGKIYPLTIPKTDDKNQHGKVSEEGAGQIHIYVQPYV